MQMNKMSSNRQMMINISATLVVFIANALINFLLSPFIVRELGVEANGFVQLATNFVAYIAIIMSAMNSMSSRFMTVAYHEKKMDRMNEYYTSTFVGNNVIIFLLLIPVSLGIMFLEHFIQISPDLVFQVKMLFLLIFLNYFVSMATPNWDISFFVTNKVYMRSIGNMVSYLVRALVIVVMFAYLPAKIWYVGVSAIMATLALQLWFYFGMRRELPALRVNRKSIKLSALKELLSSGVWNSINQLGFVLSNGLDLLITNIFIGGNIMGIVSLAKIVPSIIGGLQSTISTTFTPQLTILYSQGKIKEMVAEIYKASKITLILIGLPLTGFIAFGHPFFTLWLPGQDATQLQILSFLTMMNLAVINGSQPLWQVFVVVNKNKPDALSVIYGGIANVLITFIVLETTDLGVYAIVGISSIIGILRYLLFVIPYSAKYLGLKWTAFYPLIGYSLTTLAVNLIIGMFISKVIFINSWLTLAIAVIVFTIISGLVTSFIVLNKKERKFALKLIMSRIR
jgi:Membrane protein involved in the export of O-antigen and teichoic acid